jgi:hypothetical protein
VTRFLHSLFFPITVAVALIAFVTWVGLRQRAIDRSCEAKFPGSRAAGPLLDPRCEEVVACRAPRTLGRP